MTSRERRIAWLKTSTDGWWFAGAGRDLATTLLRKHGFDWLTDDQIDQMVELEVSRQRQRNRETIRNRNRRAA